MHVWSWSEYARVTKRIGTINFGALTMDPIKLQDARIVRSENPLNLEMPFENLDGFLTPTPVFYVRTHFPIPTIEKESWRLVVDGQVDTPLELTFSELAQLPLRTKPVTLECAGNNRDLLT